jgi:FtsZ-binding cell division protein ZapB
VKKKEVLEKIEAKLRSESQSAQAAAVPHIEYQRFEIEQLKAENHRLRGEVKALKYSLHLLTKVPLSNNQSFGESHN